jgi:hypothetical protein
VVVATREVVVVVATRVVVVVVATRVVVVEACVVAAVVLAVPEPGLAIVGEILFKPLLAVLMTSLAEYVSSAIKIMSENVALVSSAFKRDHNFHHLQINNLKKAPVPIS